MYSVRWVQHFSHTGTSKFKYSSFLLILSYLFWVILPKILITRLGICSISLKRTVFCSISSCWQSHLTSYSMFWKWQEWYDSGLASCIVCLSFWNASLTLVSWFLRKPSSIDPITCRIWIKYFSWRVYQQFIQLVRQSILSSSLRLKLSRSFSSQMPQSGWFLGPLKRECMQGPWILARLVFLPISCTLSSLQNSRLTVPCSSTLKNRIILRMSMHPEVTSRTCLQMFSQISSMSRDTIGEITFSLESRYEPSKVAIRRSIGIRLWHRWWLFVRFVSTQSEGVHSVRTVQLWFPSGLMNSCTELLIHLQIMFGARSREIISLQSAEASQYSYSSCSQFILVFWCVTLLSTSVTLWAFYLFVKIDSTVSLEMQSFPLRVMPDGPVLYQTWGWPYRQITVLGSLTPGQDSLLDGFGLHM